MTKTHLTETERWAILNALQTAATDYRKRIDEPAFKPAEYARIRQQFADQADAAMALYERLEAAEEITLAVEP